MMEEWLIYLIGTLIVVDMIIFVAWSVPHFVGARLGYRWRKLLWLVLSAGSMHLPGACAAYF